MLIQICFFSKKMPRAAIPSVGELSQGDWLAAGGGDRANIQGSNPIKNPYALAEVELTLGCPLAQ